MCEKGLQGDNKKVSVDPYHCIFIKAAGVFIVFTF